MKCLEGLLRIQHGFDPGPGLRSGGADAVDSSQGEAAHGRALVRRRRLAGQALVRQLQGQLDVHVGRHFGALHHLLAVARVAVHQEVQVVDQPATKLAQHTGRI